MKYGWEIADEVQRFVSNSADTQFVEKAVVEALREKLRIATEALELVSKGKPETGLEAYILSQALEALEKIRGGG